MPIRLTTLVLSAALLLTGCGLLSTTATRPIPQLDPRGDVYKTLGENDPLIYQPALGEKKAILLFVDFAESPSSEDTHERAEIMLNGFEELFADQSYGKLSVDVDVIHGWRSLTNPRDTYTAATTEGHRDMFAQALALYPEINFLEYDYIMAAIPGKGNFAFGQRPDEALPHRGTHITQFLNVGSRSPYTLAHELGHCMGLPDLYTYTDQVAEDAPRNPAGPWDIMSSSGRAPGFIGWNRHKLGWLDADRKTYLNEGTHTITLAPLDSDEGISLIVVPANNPEHPSTVYCIEAPSQLRMNDAPPAGVLIYSVNATLPTGHNPLIVHPRQDITHAAYHPGDTFNPDDAPMTVNVIEQNEDGSYAVEVIVNAQ